MKKFKKNVFNFLIFIFFVIFLFLILISFKEIALGHFLGGIDFSNPLFNIDYALNDGAAFGVLQEQSAFLCGIAAFVLCFILYYILVKGKKISHLERFCYALICAGIISNTIERLKMGAVVDYINLNFISFPIFNLADVFICGGAILLILTIFFKGK